MRSDVNGTRAEQSDWLVPVWLRLLFAGLTAGLFLVLVRTLTSNQHTIFGVDVKTVQTTTLIILVSMAPFAIAFCFFPKSAFSLFWFWCMRFLREQIYVLSLLGMVYFSVIRAPVLSLRGGVPYTILLFVFFVGCYLKPAGLGDAPHPALGKLFFLSRRLLAGIGHVPKWALRLFIAFLPVAVTCFWIYILLGSKLSNYGPYSWWNDEVGYWVWLRSFIHVGFNSGYNAPNELLSAIEQSRYGEASPFYLYIYGLVAGWIGWFPALPILINFVLLTVSIYLFLHIIKLDSWQAIFAGLAILLTWPVLIYLPLTTHETLNQVIGILLTIILIKIFPSHKNWSNWGRLAVVFFVYLATLVRLSWGIMLFPVLFYSLNGSLRRRIILSILLGGALYVSVIVLMGYLLPPINNSILAMFRNSFSGGAQVMLDRVGLQFRQILRYKKITPNIVVVFQMLVVVGWSFKRIWDNYRSGSSFESIIQSDAILHAYSMGMLLIAGFIFYIQGGFYRTFAPAMLIIYLWQAVRRDYKKLAALMLVNIIFFYTYMTFYANVGDYRIIENDYMEPVSWGAGTQLELEKYIVYDPDAKSPWCNTVLLPLGSYDSRLALIPPGIGISYIIDPETYQPPIRSRYVLFYQQTYEIYRDQSNLELLAVLSVGNLYRNKDVDCSTIQSK